MFTMDKTVKNLGKKTRIFSGLHFKLIRQISNPISPYKENSNKHVKHGEKYCSDVEIVTAAVRLNKILKKRQQQISSTKCPT